MTEARRRRGHAAEEIVAARLAAASWELVERNSRTRYGELDIVALDGRTLVFVEVKAAREGADFGPLRPVHAVGPRKQRQVRRLATSWLAARRGSLPRYDQIRFDAVGVSFDRDGRVSDIEHIEGAF
jgi:putative endonuclease